MEEIRRLQEEWSASGRFRSLRAQLSLEKDGLVLGANTILAKRDSGGGLCLGGNETRISTLLAVAYGGPVDRSIAGAIRRASEHARAGNEALASMHIALAPAPHSGDAHEAAKRLFIADGLIDAGVAPRDIWTALEFDPEDLDALEKGFNPAEPRNPAGEGIFSGRWVSLGEAVEAGVEDAVSAVGRAARSPLAALGVVGETANAFLSMISDASPAPLTGTVPGRRDLEYALDIDARRLRFFRPGYPTYVLEATATTAGTYLDRRGRKIARLQGTAIRFFTRALAESISERDALLTCPNPRPDRPGGRNELALDYEDYLKKQNNDPPTRRGYAYWMINPVDHNAVVVDDCRRMRTPNTPVEMKYGYDGFMSTLWGRWAMEIDWAYQATRQSEAWSGPEIEWDFSNKNAALWAESVFRRTPWLTRVHAEWKPWAGHENDQ